MLKRIILLLLICSIASAGFAQKNKRKTKVKAPRNTYFEMLVSGNYYAPNDTYCPDDTITFDFAPLDSNIKITKYCWHNLYNSINLCDTTPIKLTFPLRDEKIYPDIFYVELFIKYEVPTDTTPISLDTLISKEIRIDHIRTILDTTVCRGRDITVPTAKGDTTFYNVKKDILYTPWDKFVSVSGCDSLVRWEIKMNPYITFEYSISSCDSVIWGDQIVKRPLDFDDGDWDKGQIDSIFYAINPANYCCDCDTLKTLNITIIDKPKLQIVFDQKKFCDGDDMGGPISLETNFTAFDWTYRDADSTWTLYKPEIDEILFPGIYYVFAYMDTSLYDTLPGLRIVNDCATWRDTLVAECKLVFPNVITPNGDELNNFFGIKKLNPKRENELIIYDRWGKIVFQQKNYKCLFSKKDKKYHDEKNAFKGISRGGQELPDGVYYYAFKYDSRPRSKTYTGVLMIMR